MSVIEVVIYTVLGIAGTAFIGGAAAWIWVTVINEWRDRK